MSSASQQEGRRRRGKPKGRSPKPEALQQIRNLLGERPRTPDLLIEHLHLIQDRYGHIHADHMVALALEMRLSTVEVYEVASFYHHFELVREGHPPSPRLTVRVCDSISCALAGADNLLAELQSALADGIKVQRVPCVGRCQDAPVAMVGNNPVAEANIEKIMHLVETGATDAPLPKCRNYCEYRTEGGYELLKKLDAGSQAEKDDVIRILEASQLRGLGGAGFPAGRKWRILRDQPEPRMFAVNIDEGEPGTFKDRHFLERDPHRFLEGMLIAAKVVGIAEVYIYLRDEYAGIRAMLERELGELLVDPPCRLPPIHLRRGAGAYICGEESAMIESIEGKRGMPRLRPPYVAESGLFGRPTLEHNMETLYWVRDLLEKGPAWFAEQGRHGRSGLRAFSVSGRVRLPGVHLAPAGITLHELIDEHCGGMAEGHELYAYFPGGASGGILPASLADVPLDFDTLQPYGCFIGSAAIIVLSQQDSAREAALNAMRFFAYESCGKCTPCRVGTAQAALLMQMSKWNQPLLRELAEVMVDASICGLGQAAPNPMRSVMNYFAHELETD